MASQSFESDDILAENLLERGSSDELPLAPAPPLPPSDDARLPSSIAALKGSLQPTPAASLSNIATAKSKPIPPLPIGKKPPIPPPISGRLQPTGKGIGEDDERTLVHSSASSDVQTPRLDIGEYFDKTIQHVETFRNPKRLVIGIDYGTTFTGLAYAYTDTIDVDLEKIEVIEDWTPKMSNQHKVRSLISYSKAFSGEAQWGTDISKNATTMVNTKLELDPQDSIFDELELTLNVLKGTGNLSFDQIRKAGPDPAYTCKPPTQIVTDYITKIYECMRNTIDLDTLTKTGTTVDIVVTVPVNWSYQANDSTFRAIRAAGFNKTNFPTLRDTVLVSEPEAASHFTVHDLQSGGTEFLKKNECFVVCDAGGGTVDVVSFQVKRTDPFLEFEKATAPKSEKCGSAFIDTAFKNWLRRVIGEDAYERLDPATGRQRISAHTAESGPMRTLIANFEVKKKAFSGSNEDVKLNLPAPLDHYNMRDRVIDGELIIRGHEMKEMVDSCVTKVIELIKDQVTKIRKGKHSRTKNVFLVGGFGESEYLQKELRRSLEMRNMEMRRPDLNKSWTAVVQGAVIYGVEKSRHPDANYMASITKSYGIIKDGRFEWLIRRGDLILSQTKKIVQGPSFMISRDHITRYQLPIYYYVDHDGKDDVPDSWEEGQHEVEIAGTVKCDFSKYLDLDVDLRASRMHGRASTIDRTNGRIGPLRCQLDISQTEMEVGVFLENARAGRCEIPVEVDQPRPDRSNIR